jgi:5'-deoxynucleotidase YfbR-like HD superfamily hydrolase
MPTVRPDFDRAPGLDRAVALARLALVFGTVERITLHPDRTRAETDTTHTVMLALIACDLAPGHLDLGLVAQFAVVHDLIEAKTGDVQTLVIDEAGRRKKETDEALAMLSLRDEFGADSWLVTMLEAYEHQLSPEARFVRLLDKVLPKIVHLLSGCAGAKKVTDFVGFKESHRKQREKLLAEYGDVAPEIHALLAEAMAASERAWEESTWR